jgi:predicted nucleic acid-binding protein
VGRGTRRTTSGLKPSPANRSLRIIVSRETLICDTSFVSHLLSRRERPERYSHWSVEDVTRIRASLLAISIVTIGELRAGYMLAGWGSRRIAKTERQWADFLPLLIDDPHLNEWARLSIAARTSGVALSDNDLWIAATASVGSRVLVTCDRDHVRIAPELAGEVLYLQPPV